MKTNIILSVLAFTLITGYNATAQTLGNACGSTSNPLTMDWEIPLDGYTFNFSEQATTPSQVRIGYPNCTPSTVARLNVLNDILQAAGYFQTSVNTSTVSLGTASFAENTGGSSIGLYAEGIGIGISGEYAKGVDGRAIDGTYTADQHIGVDAKAANGNKFSAGVNSFIEYSSSPENYAYKARISDNPITSRNYGLNVIVNSPASINYGAYIDVSNASTNNYGIFVNALPAATPPSFGPNYAAYMNGDVYINGNVFATSDKNLKENITSFSGANQLLNTLNPVTFDYKQTGEYEKLHLPAEHQYGLIAQEVETILPTFVKEIVSPTEYDTLGNVSKPSMTFKSLNYNGLIPILVQGHREQSSQIDSLENAIANLNNTNTTLITANSELHAKVNQLNDRLTQLENCLSRIVPNLCEINQSTTEQTSEEIQAKLIQEINIILDDKNNIILNQNIPNPFAERTTITYTIPETVGSAEIIFYDAQGKTIQSATINERGKGKLNIYANDLSTGIYSYTLFADGKAVATKRMMKD